VEDDVKIRQPQRAEPSGEARSEAARAGSDRRRARRLVAIGLASALLLSACGSDDDDEATGEGEGGAAEAPEAPPTDTEGTLRFWLNANDTPQPMVDAAIAEFNETYPNVTVNLERQQWDGLVERLTNVLPTEDGPDIFEVGNTQAQGFEAAGAMVDLTASKDDLGGDDLLDSLVEAGTYDDKFYGVPLYAGARVVVYRTDLFEKSNLEIPTTLDEFIEAGKTLQADNADTPNFSGIYFPGRNWHAMLSFIWDAGGDIATQEDGEWVGQLSSDESIEGLETVQDIMENANQAPPDTDDADDFVDFCNGEIGMLMAPGWKPGQLLDPEQGCPDTMGDKIGAFALPGSSDAVAPVFLGGSNVAISAQSENAELALEFLKVLAGEDFQTAYGENGLIPARKSLLDSVKAPADAAPAVVEAAEAQAEAAAGKTRFVPASENWAEVEGQEILQDMGTAIGSGADVKEEAERADAAIEEILNG
jgi:N,N'-diacetylchitobiose transport system substrate-binding protein